MNEKDVITYLEKLPAAELNKLLKKALILKKYTALLGEMINTCIELNSR